MMMIVTIMMMMMMKVTQYECGNLMMPMQDCLQYHTAQSGGQRSLPPHIHIMLF